jgi:hypothetical protein
MDGARHGTAVSSRTRAGPFGLLALQATSHGTNNESTSRGVLCPLLCWARPFSAISSVRVRCRSHCLFRICAEQRTRRVPFEGRLWAKARARTPAEGRPPRWKERAQCDGAALSRSARPGHIHNRARLLTTTDVRPFISSSHSSDFSPWGKGSSVSPSNSFSHFPLPGKMPRVPDDTCIGPPLA